MTTLLGRLAGLPLAILRASAPTAGLATPVDAAGVVLFRFLLGAILAYEAYAYIADGYVGAFFVGAPFHAKYWGFGWVQPWPEPWMTRHFQALITLGTGMALGVYPRLCAGLYGLLFGYAFLIAKGRYLNHHYLVILLCVLFTLTPSIRWRARDGGAGTCPAWVYALLRFQIGLVYLYAAVAKLTPDWLAGLPMRSMLRSAGDLPVLGELSPVPVVALAFAYGGLLIDAAAYPCLIWRRTRVPMTLALMFFHLTNAAFLDIGIFPWTMLCTTFLFYAPDLPRRATSLLASAFFLFPVRSARAWLEDRARPAPPPVPAALTVGPLRLYLAAWVTLQVLLPLRHWLVPGNPEWHDVGHRWAWRMKLRSRRAAARFYVYLPTSNEYLTYEPRDFCRSWQTSKVARDPDQLHQFALFLADHHAALGQPGAQVRAVALVSLNRRPAQLLVDPTVDLAAQPRVFGVPAWVKPLAEPPPPLDARVPPDPSKLLRKWPLRRVFPASVPRLEEPTAPSRAQPFKMHFRSKP